MKRKLAILAVLSVIGVVVVAYSLFSTTQLTDSTHYVNGKWGFSLDYSDQFELGTEDLPQALENPVVGFELIDQAYFTGRNLREASVLVGVSESITEQLCTTLRSFENAPQGSPDVVEIGETEFHVGQISEGAVGNYYETTTYRAFHNNTCYEIALYIHSLSIGAFTPGEVREFEREAVINLLQDLAFSFQCSR